MATATEAVHHDKKIPIIEIFGPTIQGEGALAGKRTFFIRTGGCGYRCEWCDTMYAVDPVQVKKNSTLMKADQIVNELSHLTTKQPAEWVTISGGDPVMHNLRDLVHELGQYNFSVAVETQGQFFKPWLQLVKQVTVSPKGPSSGMEDKLDHEILEAYVDMHWAQHNVCFKVVIFNEQDLKFAIEIHEEYPDIPFYLSVGTPQHESFLALDIQRATICRSMKWLFERAVEEVELRDVTILPQLHTLAWGNRRGV